MLGIILCAVLSFAFFIFFYKEAIKKIKNPLYLKISEKEVAKKILEKNNLLGVKIFASNDKTNYYDAVNKNVVLADFDSDTPTSRTISIAAHEVGHAIQFHRYWSMLLLIEKIKKVSIILGVISFFLVLLTLFFPIGHIFQFVFVLFLFSLFLWAIVMLFIEGQASYFAYTELLSLSFLQTNSEKKEARFYFAIAFLTYFFNYLFYGSLLSLFLFI